MNSYALKFGFRFNTGAKLFKYILTAMDPCFSLGLKFWVVREHLFNAPKLIRLFLRRFHRPLVDIRNLLLVAGDLGVHVAK